MAHPHSHVGRASAWQALVLPSVVLTAGAFLVGAELAESGSPLDATTGGAPSDMDADGLLDQSEWILGTDPLRSDTDEDGFADIEELARQSDPAEPTSVPPFQDISLSMSARASGGQVYLEIPIYLRESSLKGLDFRLGVVINGIQAEIEPAAYLPITTFYVVPGADPLDSILVLNVALPETLVLSFGFTSFYATAAPAGATGPTTATVLNLTSSGGVVMALTQQVHGGGQTIGSVYRPIHEIEDIPDTWNPGEICSQETQIIGTVGNLLRHQVIDARCDSADTHCMPACTGLIGSTYDELDPLTLIGG